MVGRPCLAYIGCMTLQILLAEDNQTFANSVTRFVGLISGAHMVAHAKDGDEALEKAIELHPDLILMDIAMPKQSGLQVAQQLQGLQRCPKIIFLSMHSDSSYREAARNVGGSYFVTKANFVSELFPLIEQMVRDHELHHLRAMDQSQIAARVRAEGAALKLSE